MHRTIGSLGTCSCSRLNIPSTARLLPQRRLKSEFRLKPDPNRVPRTISPEERMKNAAPKTGTIEDFQLYERATPPNSITSVLQNGFKLENGTRVISDTEKTPRGLVLIGHEAFGLDLNGGEGTQGLKLGRVEFDLEKQLAVFGLVHPKPELVMVGLGGKSRILGPRTQAFFRKLGMQTDVSTTRAAASSYDMLVSERGQNVAALLLPSNI